MRQNSINPTKQQTFLTSCRRKDCTHKQEGSLLTMTSVLYNLIYQTPFPLNTDIPLPPRDV